MTVTISRVLLERIRHQAHANYPDECCGLLLGQEAETDRFVRDIREVQNSFEGLRHNRYLISPTDVYEAEKSAQELGLQVIGVYHSHPDHAAQPSQIDRENAIPHFSYIIMSVMNGLAGELSCWTFAYEDVSFSRQSLLISD